MTRIGIETDAAPKSPAYSQAIKSNGLVFVSGQGPFEARTGEVVGTTIEAQAAPSCRSVPGA